MFLGRDRESMTSVAVGIVILFETEFSHILPPPPSGLGGERQPDAERHAYGFTISCAHNTTTVHTTNRNTAHGHGVFTSRF